MRNPCPQDLPDVRLIDGDHEVETLPPDGTDQPLAKGVSLGRTVRRSQWCYAQDTKRGIELRGEDAIAVVNDEPVALVSGNALAELLQCPFRRGMLRHIEVDDSARSHLHHEVLSGKRGRGSNAETDERQAIKGNTEEAANRSQYGRYRHAPSMAQYRRWRVGRRFCARQAVRSSRIAM